MCFMRCEGVIDTVTKPTYDEVRAFDNKRGGEKVSKADGFSKAFIRLSMF